MQLQQLHWSGACSSAILLNLGYNYVGYTTEEQRETVRRKFLAELYVRLHQQELRASGSLNSGLVCCTYGQKTTYMAFLVASTLSNQPVPIDVFKRLGAQSTAPEFNAKNQTKPTLHTLSIPKLKERLEEMIKNDPLFVEEIDAIRRRFGLEDLDKVKEF